ncbi:glycosyltransferase family 2 protein [Occallatibacter savannae]|uniref:glycosyltransferase family 2 protein n=1 Tax=Occallatibacter savannae TaxID=1002691 RepID=UPI001950F3C8|nr:glycosyltransferase family 2 protein [Occallatibacter savannae]
MISIVTPSFNQGKYLEETIRSVLLQGYPKLQYIVIDGGSSDESLSILQKYGPWLSYWVSKPDRGQPSAINEGLQMATGTLFGFLNSDDLLAPGALFAIAEAHLRAPENLVAGDVIEFRETQDRVVQRVDQSGLKLNELIQFWTEPNWHQPGVFITRKLFDIIGPYDESHQFGFDYDFMLRALHHAEVTHVRDVVALFRLHENSKTCSGNALQVMEQFKISRRYWGDLKEGDKRAARRYTARILFGSGCSNLIRRRRMGLRLLVEGLSIDPVYAIANAGTQFPGWVSRKLRRSLSIASRTNP